MVICTYHIRLPKMLKTDDQLSRRLYEAQIPETTLRCCFSFCVGLDTSCFPTLHCSLSFDGNNDLRESRCDRFFKRP
jgi:hypothetical protein